MHLRRKPKFGLPDPFTLNTLLFSCHILSGCRKMFRVNYGQSLKMGPWLIIGQVYGAILPPFFCAKTDDVIVVSKFATSGCPWYTETTAAQIDVVLLSAYQECLMTFKSTTSQVVQRALLLKGHCHGILASFYYAEICSCIHGNPKIMMQFCYLRLYHYTETIYCRLALSMARMEMDCNLKKLASFFKF